jgi:ribosomal protein S18 acetylase RimI-like enzyme
MTAPIRIRPAIRADLDELVALEQATFTSDRLSPRQYARHLAGDALVLAARAGGALVGSALVFFRRGSTAARLYSIAVARAARGTGLGAALLGAAERGARRRGADRLRLEVRSDNRVAIALYEARGYRRFGRHAAYYEDGTDALRYEKRLR